MLLSAPTPLFTYEDMLLLLDRAIIIDESGLALTSTDVDGLFLFLFLLFLAVNGFNLFTASLLF